MSNQATATKGNKKAAVSATNFVKVVRALLRGSPRSATAASASAVAIPVPASEADEEENNCKEAATHHQIRTTTSRESRAALDISGHRFANNLQVEIGRTRNRRQQSVVSERAGSDDARSLSDGLTQRQQHQHHHQQRQSTFFYVPEEEEGRGPFSSSRTWLKDARRGVPADGDKLSPRSSRASSTTSTLPPSPDAAGTAAAARSRSELPPLVPKTSRSRCTTGTCRQQQQQRSPRAAFFA